MKEYKKLLFFLTYKVVASKQNKQSNPETFPVFKYLLVMQGVSDSWVFKRSFDHSGNCTSFGSRLVPLFLLGSA